MDVIGAQAPRNRFLELQTIDGMKIKVDGRIINMSRVLKDAVEAEDDEDECPLVPCFEIHSDQLKLIIQYCEYFDFKHKSTKIPIPIPEGEMKAWIKDEWELAFFKKLDVENLSKLLTASNYLNISSLFETCCATMAWHYKGQNFQKIRGQLGIADNNNQSTAPQIGQFNPTSCLTDIQDQQLADERLMEQYPWIFEEMDVNEDSY